MQLLDVEIRNQGVVVRGECTLARHALCMAILFAASGFALPNLQCVAGEVDPACVAQLRSEGVQAWRAAEQLSHSTVVECTAIRTERYLQNGSWREDVQERRYRIALDPDHCRRIVECFVPASGYTRRVVVNPRYRFNVCRSEVQGHNGDAKDRAAPWELTRVNSGSKSELWSEMVPFETEQVWHAEASYQVLTIPLSELISGADFQLLAAEYRTAPDGTRQAYVEAEYTGQESGIWRQTGTVFWAQLRPAPSWLISEGGARRPSGFTAKFAIDYRALPDGQEFPDRLAYEEKDPQHTNKFSVRDEAQYDLPSARDIDDAEYSLAFYGIPETAAAEIPRRSSRGLVVISSLVVGAALLLLGWLGFRRIR